MSYMIYRMWMCDMTRWFVPNYSNRMYDMNVVCRSCYSRDSLIQFGFTVVHFTHTNENESCHAHKRSHVLCDLLTMWIYILHTQIFYGHTYKWCTELNLHSTFTNDLHSTHTNILWAHIQRMYAIESAFHIYKWSTFYTHKYSIL